MSDQPREAIAAEIRAHGPIGFDGFMELALYGPGGFYERPPVGTGSERAFATSPHVHPVFAQLLAGGVMELWDLLGRPEPFRVTEVGAGDGTLARQLVEALAEIPLDYTTVERSPGAREALAAGGFTAGASLSGEPHLVLAHELLDNLPFRRVRLTTAGPREVRVSLDGDRFIEMLTDADADIREAAAALSEPGEETVLPRGTFEFIDDLAARLTHGYALLIDYGALGSTGGPVHGYAAQRLVEDLLADPGGADITSGVDFAAVALRAEGAGLPSFGSLTQRETLTALGFERWTLEELSRQTTLLDERRGVEAVRAWSGRIAAGLLIDPSALGRLRWLLLASPGLPVPSWFTT